MRSQQERSRLPPHEPASPLQTPQDARESDGDAPPLGGLRRLRSPPRPPPTSRASTLREPERLQTHLDHGRRGRRPALRAARVPGAAGEPRPAARGGDHPGPADQGGAAAAQRGAGPGAQGPGRAALPELRPPGPDRGAPDHQSPRDRRGRARGQRRRPADGRGELGGGAQADHPQLGARGGAGLGRELADRAPAPPRST